MTLVVLEERYTTHEGVNLADEKCRKLGVFQMVEVGRRLEGSHSHLIVILISIRQKEAMMLGGYLNH